MKAATKHDITVGGADLAGQALLAGLVDEIHLFAVPVVVGGGKRWLPGGGRLDLVLLDIRRFASGVVFLSYGLSVWVRVRRHRRSRKRGGVAAGTSELLES